MRFLVDAQLPPALARFFEARGHEAKAAREVGLRQAEDPAVWTFALAGAWIVVTKDEDFAIRISVVPTGPAIVWLRIGNTSKQALLGWFAPLLPRIESALAAGERIVEVA